MTVRARARAATTLGARLEALREAVDLARGRVPGPVLDGADAVLERASRRRSLSAGHTVVGFFGTTGSGKSSLFNAVTGTDRARVAATRPTTARPLAAVRGPEGSGELLDWLGVAERTEIGALPGPGADADGLILLDLPDIDSTALAHRETAERLAGQVDVLVWVVDPQKYADAAVHRDFLGPLRALDAVTLVVLNQIDRLAPGEASPVVDSLRSLVEREGLRRSRVLATSAATGEGVDALRSEIAAYARRRLASTERLAADADGLAARLGPYAEGDGAGAGPADRERLAAGLGGAAGVDAVVDAVARSYRHRARARTGWPLTRWLGALRVDPLRRLHLDGRGTDPSVHRSSLPAPGPAQHARSEAAVRHYAEAASAGLPEVWRGSVRRAARRSAPVLPDRLDQAIASTDLGARRGSWWWPLAGLLQWIALACAVAGAGWLLALAGAGFLQLPLPPPPRVEGFAVPTLMLAAGLAAGVLVALASGFASRLGARWRARAARRRLLAAVRRVAGEHVADPVAAELDRFRGFRAALGRARG